MTAKTRQKPIKTIVAASPSKPRKPARPAPLDLQGLLERSLSAIAEVSGGTWGVREDHEVIAAMDVCRAAGRVDLARALADAIPVGQRGRVLLSLALAGHAAADDLIDATLAGLALVRLGHSACMAAASAIDAARLFPGARGRDRLLDAAGQLAERCFAADSFGGFEAIVRAYFELGERDRVAAWVSRAPLSLPDNLASGVWSLGSPSQILLRVHRHNADVAVRSNAPWFDLTCWSIAEVTQLADIAIGTWSRPHLARALMTLGRIDHARTLVIDDPEFDSLPLVSRIERHALVGDRDAAHRLLRDAPPPADEFLAWSKMQLEHGLRDFDALWPLAAARPPGTSVMSAVQQLALLIDCQLDAGAAPTSLQPALAALDALFADPFRSQYDRGVEGSRRTQVARLRARFDLASGHRARAQAQLEADFADLPAWLAFGKDLYARTELLRGLLARAAMVGRPDIALKVARRVPPTYRSEHAASAARAYLPDAPGDALKALDHVATSPARQLLDGRGLLAELWSAVLLASPHASAPV